MPSRAEETCPLLISGTTMWSTWHSVRTTDRSQFKCRNLVREFYNMFAATGRHLKKDLPLSLNWEEFNDGYSLFVFNLNLNDDSKALSPVSSGTLRLEMRFRFPLAYTTTLIVYSCYDSVLEISSKRQVLVDYY